MSAIHTSYQSRMISTSNTNNPQEKMNKIQLPVYKYLDIDSTYRNRIDYPDPNSFIVRNSNSSNVSSNNLVAYNLPVYSFPMSQLYVGGVYTPLAFQNIGNDNLVLDTRETTSVPNFYAGYYMESISPTTAAPTTAQYSNIQYTTIAEYNDTTQVVTFTTPLTTATTVVGTNYIIRKNKPLFIGNVQSIDATNTIVNLYISAGSSGYGSIPNDRNSVYYLRVRKSGSSSLDNRIVQFTFPPIPDPPALPPPSNQIILNSPLALQVDDSIEIIGPGQNIITSLRYASGGSQSIQGGDYELELLWLSVPNQILDVGYGGTLDRYPYIYCSLYTGITNTTQQVLYSNNPYTSKVLFKVPVNEYFGDTSFITLKDSKAKQTIYFDPSQDLFFELTLPDGTVISFNEFDNMPPYPPNPFLQINILVSMKKL
jgi:hypothetical protein